MAKAAVTLDEMISTEICFRQISPVTQGFFAGSKGPVATICTLEPALW
jgi:hypothetical protein